MDRCGSLMQNEWSGEEDGLWTTVWCLAIGLVVATSRLFGATKVRRRGGGLAIVGIGVIAFGSSVVVATAAPVQLAVIGVRIVALVSSVVVAAAAVVHHLGGGGGGSELTHCCMWVV